MVTIQVVAEAELPRMLRRRVRGVWSCCRLSRCGGGRGRSCDGAAVAPVGVCSAATAGCAEWFRDGVQRQREGGVRADGEGCCGPVVVEVVTRKERSRRAPPRDRHLGGRVAADQSQQVKAVPLLTETVDGNAKSTQPAGRPAATGAGVGPAPARWAIPRRSRRDPTARTCWGRGASVTETRTVSKSTPPAGATCGSVCVQRAGLRAGSGGPERSGGPDCPAAGRGRRRLTGKRRSPTAPGTILLRGRRPMRGTPL